MSRACTRSRSRSPPPRSCSPGCPRTRTPRGRRWRRCWPPAPPRSASARWSPRSAARPTSWRTRCCPRRPSRARSPPSAPATSRAWTRGPSGSSSPAWAATAVARTTRSTTAWGCRRSPPSDRRSGLDTPLAIVHARGDASAAEAATALLSAVTIGAGAARRATGAAGARMSLPLAELHVHLEGTVPPALIQKLADRNGLQRARRACSRRRTASGGSTSSTSCAPTTSRRASSAREQDYRDITYEYLMGCAREGAIYVELIVSPDHAALVGLPAAEHYAGIAAGIDDARRDGDIEARMLATAVRNFGVEAGGRDHARARRGPPPLRRRLQPRGRRGGLPTRPVSRGVRDRRELRARVHRPRGRARRGRVGPRGAHAARDAPLARSASGGRPCTGAGNRRARDRARGLSHVQHRDQVSSTRTRTIHSASSMKRA